MLSSRGNQRGIRDSRPTVALPGEREEDSLNSKFAGIETCRLNELEITDREAPQRRYTDQQALSQLAAVTDASSACAAAVSDSGSLCYFTDLLLHSTKINLLNRKNCCDLLLRQRKSDRPNGGAQ